MTETVTPADGAYVTDGLPHGSTSLTPHIVVSPAADALEFYPTVFGATVEDVTRFGDQIAHAELDFGNGRLTLSDPLDGYQLAAPNPSGGSDYSLALYVRDVDAVMKRAVAAGATVREDVSTFVSGDRFGSVLDPFGVRWSIMTRIEDVSPEESRRRVAEWAAAQVKG
jgi:PhnB protein